MMKIYLDACCLNRPFDDQFQDRVRLESEAILLIIKHFENRDWTWFGSEVLNYELEQIPDLDRWQKVRSLTKYVHTVVVLDLEIISRAQQLEALGFKAFDALHIACAEKAGADVFLTTDNHILHLSDRFSNQLKIKLNNPLVWFHEVIKE